MGHPKQQSIFLNTTIEDIYKEIRDVYLRYPQPWVIGYSGGKDSTAVVQLTWIALEGLPPEDREKPVFVIASDTKVEAPAIVNYIDTTLNRISQTAQSRGMPFIAEKVMPTLNDSFWVNLIGRGYPAPTSHFRWCTERMKIKPANRFIAERVAQHGEVIMVLGVRESESATRMQLMNTHKVKGHFLHRHSTLPGAYVYAPIAAFSTEDIWTYLLNVQSPWGSKNRDLAALYRNAQAGECPLVIDTSTPSCGNSRFGCWVCTVATRDTSMESLIDSGEEWMQPLLEFRDRLFSTTDPKRKREFRDIRGRDGTVYIKDGAAIPRTYKLTASQEMLERVLSAEKEIKEKGPDPSVQLISEEELLEIRRIWRTERQDWEDSVPAIYRNVYNTGIQWHVDDNPYFHSEEKDLLLRECNEEGVPFELLARLLEIERSHLGMARRVGLQKEVERILSREWRSEEDLVNENAGAPSN